MRLAVLVLVACGGSPQPAPVKPPPPEVPVATKVEQPVERVAVSDVPVESTLTSDVVLEKIQAAYMTGIQRCYKTHLKVDPSARGTVALQFTVNEVGAAINGTSTGFAKDVDDCIAAQILNWQFPIPKDADGEATTADFKISLRLVAE